MAESVVRKAISQKPIWESDKKPQGRADIFKTCPSSSHRVKYARREKMPGRPLSGVCDARNVNHLLYIQESLIP